MRAAARAKHTTSKQLIDVIMLPDDLVWTIIRYADIPLYALCRICKYAREIGEARPLHINMGAYAWIPERVNARTHSLTMRDFRIVYFDKYSALTSLDVHNGCIYDSDIAALTQLRRLAFTQCRRITNEGISTLTNLRHIYVNDIITDRGISALTNLRTIGIGASIGSVSAFTKLRSLHMRETSIIPPTHIQHLHITDNITLTERDIAACTRLQSLSLHGKTRIATIRARPCMLSLIKNTVTTMIPSCVTALTVSPGVMYNVTANQIIIIYPVHNIVNVNGKKFAFVPKPAGSKNNIMTPRARAPESMYVWPGNARSRSDAV